MPLAVPALIVGVGFFLAVWLAIMAILSHLGWARLARSFPGDELSDRSAPRLRFQSLMVNTVSYNNCVTIEVTPSGLRLRCSPHWAFPFHRPIFLPWNVLDIISVNEGWCFNNVVVDVGRPAMARLRLPSKILSLAEQLRTSNRSSPDVEEQSEVTQP